MSKNTMLFQMPELEPLPLDPSPILAIRPPLVPAYVGRILESLLGMLVVGLRSPLLSDWKTCVVKTASVLFFHCELNSLFRRLKTKEISNL